MRLRFFGTLDRYVLKQWLTTFTLSIIGVPTVAVVIDFAERFGKVAGRGVPVRDIFLGQLFLFPAKIVILVPAAVLFATVFTLNTMGRHSELTAVQSGGVSFYRLITPMMMLAALAVPLDYGLQELAGFSTLRHNELHRDKASTSTALQHGFAYASPSGWTWAFVEMMQKDGNGRAAGVLGEGARNAAGDRWTVTADSAVWDNASRTWTISKGATHLLADSLVRSTILFNTLRVKDFTETPGDLMKEDKRAEEMSVAETKEHIARLRGSGSVPLGLEVDLQLKYAVPVACLVVALFAAPLAITNARAGATVGLAIALGTTLVYLTGTQIMKSIGGKGELSPEMAAWSMNLFFICVAGVLMSRVKS